MEFSFRHKTLLYCSRIPFYRAYCLKGFSLSDARDRGIETTSITSWRPHEHTISRQVNDTEDKAKPYQEVFPCGWRNEKRRNKWIAAYFLFRLQIHTLKHEDVSITVVKLFGLDLQNFSQKGTVSRCKINFASCNSKLWAGLWIETMQSFYDIKFVLCCINCWS